MSSFIYGAMSNVDIKIFQKTGAETHYPTASISEAEIEKDYTIIGGGAIDNWEGYGNLLTASRPEVDTENRVIGWVASGKDQTVSDPATITVFAVGMKVTSTDKGAVIPIKTKCFTKKSEKANHPTVSIFGSDIDSGYLIVDGGALDDWSGYGNLLTASVPVLDANNRVVGWSASGKDQKVSDPSVVTVYAIGMYLEGANYNFDVRARSVVSTKVAHPVVKIEDGNRVIGGGAVDNWTGYGNLLTASAPILDVTETRPVGWFASGKDQTFSDPATITVFVLELTPFNAVYGKVQASPDWNYMVDVCRNVTIDQAQAHALADNRITYFFRVIDGKKIDLGDHGVFNSGDAVFFALQPSYSAAEGVTDIYQKSAPNLIATNVSLETGFTYLKASMTVPEGIGYSGTLFFWPGLQSSVSPGVLQPVLTYGPSCAPNPTKISDNQWWISGQYVTNVCKGGPRMALKAGNMVTVTMEYDDSNGTWTQTCESNGNNVSFKIPLPLQTMCIFANENPPGPVYGGSYMDDSFSLYDVTVKTKAPFKALANDFRSRLNVIGLKINPNFQEFTIERVLVYSPIAR